MACESTGRAAHAELAGGDVFGAGDADDGRAASAARDRVERDRDVSLARRSETDRCEQLRRVPARGELLGAVESVVAGAPVLAGRDWPQQVEDGAAVLPELDARLHATTAARGGYRDHTEARARPGRKDHEPAVGAAARDGGGAVRGARTVPPDEVLGADGGDRVEPVDRAGGGVGVAAAVATTSAHVHPAPGLRPATLRPEQRAGDKGGDRRGDRGDAPD